MSTIAMTGATGLVGIHALAALLARDGQRVIVLGRDQPDLPLRERLTLLLHEQGLAHTIAALDRVTAVNSHLDQPDLSLGPAEWAVLRQCDVLLHIAGHTTFLKDKRSAEMVTRVNVHGVDNLLAVASQLDLKRVVHVSSAYSAGAVQGHVQPDLALNEGFFPNPYQRSKFIGEQRVRQWGQVHGVPVVVARPSTVGGRLLGEPRGAVTKYDVFLGWAKALKRLRRVLGEPAGEGRYNVPVRLALRPDAGLNIVPVDFAGPALAWLATGSPQGTAYHLAAPHAVPHHDYVAQMLDAVGVDGFVFQDARPADMTRVERIYYARLGDVFADYVERPPLTFDLTTQHEIEAGLGWACPNVDGDAFSALLAYAVERDFE